MSTKRNSLPRIIAICIISGLLSGVFVNLIFWTIFPSGWLFLIIPIFVGWSLDKFAKIPSEEILDDETMERLSKQTGMLCAVMVLLVQIVAVLPVLLLLDPIEILTNFVFYIGCALCVYIGYSRGVQSITDAYYDAKKSEE